MTTLHTLGTTLTKLKHLYKMTTNQMCLNILYESGTLLWYAEKRKVFTQNIYVYLLTFTKNFSPCLLSLGAQIRCAQNQYTADQTDLKYPLHFY